MRPTLCLLSCLVVAGCSRSPSEVATSNPILSASAPPRAPDTAPRTASPLASAGHPPDAAESPRPTGTARVGHTSASCAPWDGGAVDLVVDDLKECATTPRAMIAIAIWKSLPLTSGKVIQFRDGSQEGSGRRCPADGSKCVMAKHVELVVDSYDEKTMAMTGYYTMTFADGSTVSELFTATRCGGQAICG